MPAWLYLLVAPILLLSENLAVILTFRARGIQLIRDESFWLAPLARLTELSSLPALWAALLTLFFLLTAWALVIVSLRRAARSRTGYGLAFLMLIPGIKIAAVALLAVLPVRAVRSDEDDGSDAVDARDLDEPMIVAHLVQGALAGMAIIVAAVLVSALTFGAYGWGLFVLTPFTTGMTTAYIANRQVAIGGKRTMQLVLGAAALGCAALLALALEGLVCVLLIAPLGALMAMAGGAVGLGFAGIGHQRGKPLLTVALLPAVFVLEAAMPPFAAIQSQDSVIVAARPIIVWRALTSDAPIVEPPGLVGRAGLAYALGGRILSPGVGGDRLGYFSTGVARERITQWTPGRRLAFAVVRQPPAMEEMSPYRRVHAPHVNGYFDTGTTRFDLAPLPGGRTRLTIHTDHVLRIDPIPYWEPLARWAIHRNSRRVLDDIREKAERDGRI